MSSHPVLLDVSDGGRLHRVRASRTVWLITAVLVLLIAWSAWAQVNETTRGKGRVTPSSRLQSVQSLEGGILTELLVREGGVVHQGQPLARIDSTRFQSAYNETQSQIDTLSAEVGRLEAEVSEKSELTFSDHGNDKARQSEVRLFNARRARLNKSIGALQEEDRILQQQIAMIRPLVEKQSAPRSQLLQLQQQSAQLHGRIGDLRNQYVQEAYSTMVDKKAKLAELQQSMLQKKDQLNRTLVTAHVAGLVNNVKINSVGGVVQPGETIMEITPIHDQLVVETLVEPKDVAFIAPDMPASVKISAYDYSVYGDLRGKVTQISEDTVKEDTPHGPQEYYRVMVTTDRSHLKRNGVELPIRAGMVAEVDIETGRRSILSYLTRPLMKARLR
ncbi:HlyD family efflux transporter periplasmic adaptor subunit [Chitinasiproducens palmae]|uniref:Membrane fusion protein, adhesin transport system n=1 Tax=Chitinasiproducens palmae TaxID=1770053 RepID=A0A1H2PJW2_9BURK|nr:HlyD family efflux transporter periplasmic adaptor subunit [Chitinasiproducens palmae]SDV46214.1 membrane fusion protein, adhesin transport system [Chitinasiproducens palmae]